MHNYGQKQFETRLKNIRLQAGDKFELFVKEQCIITPAFKCNLSDLSKVYSSKYSKLKMKGPRECNGLIARFKKLGIKFDFGVAYGVALKSQPMTLESEPRVEEPVARRKSSFVRIDKEKYGEYLASREWWVKREAVMRRAQGMCERCRKNRATAVHHRTYARIYKELLTDLQAICKGCHDFTHALSNIDPAK